MRRRRGEAKMANGESAINGIGGEKAWQNQRKRNIISAHAKISGGNGGVNKR